MNDVFLFYLLFLNFLIVSRELLMYVERVCYTMRREVARFFLFLVFMSLLYYIYYVFIMLLSICVKVT